MNGTFGSNGLNAYCTAEREKCVTRYLDAVADLPPPGEGHQLHCKLLSVANFGVCAGMTADAVFNDLRKNIPGGERTVPDSEVQAAVEKAFRDGGRPSPSSVAAIQPQVQPVLRDHLIEMGRDWDEARILDASPTPIPKEVQGHGVFLLDKLYNHNDYLFIGERHATKVQTVGKWLQHWKAGGNLGPFVIPNPMTGEIGRTKDDKDSYRSDDCVADFRFAMAEFDDLSRDDQLSFWAAIDLPIAALIDSGGKSIHAWIRVDCADSATWECEIEQGLYMARLVPLGVDSGCRNESRLSRMPGYFRQEKQRWQRLLYLCPEGRQVHHDK